MKNENNLLVSSSVGEIYVWEPDISVFLGHIHASWRY